MPALLLGCLLLLGGLGGSAAADGRVPDAGEAAAPSIEQLIALLQERLESGEEAPGERPAAGSEDDAEGEATLVWPGDASLPALFRETMVAEGSALARLPQRCMPGEPAAALLIAEIVQAEVGTPPWRSRSPFHAPPTLPDPRRVHEALDGEAAEGVRAALAALEGVDALAAPWARDLVANLPDTPGACRAREVAAIAGLWREPAEWLEANALGIQAFGLAGPVPRGSGWRLLLRLHVSGAEDASARWADVLLADAEWEADQPFVEALLGLRSVASLPEPADDLQRWVRAERMRQEGEMEAALASVQQITRRDPLFVAAQLTRAALLQELGREADLREAALFLRSLRHQQPGYEVPIGLLLERAGLLDAPAR